MAEQRALDPERERLEDERAMVQQEIGRLRESLQIEPELELDDGDPVVIVREQNLAMLRDFEARLREIDHALDHIRDGIYGICERCGRQIDPERLRIVPEATLCVSCKSELEKQRRFY